MARDDIQPGDRFSITFRTSRHGEGQWHFLAERADPRVAMSLYDELIADDRAHGADIGSRWRLCHDRGSEIIRVMEDRTLNPAGLVPTDSI